MKLKPLGYYLESLTAEQAKELEGKINDLNTDDLYALTEWLLHRMRDDAQNRRLEESKPTERWP